MKITVERRDAAVADYRNGIESLAVVAKRHGVSTTTLHNWVRPVGNRRPSEQLGLPPGKWVIDLRRRILVWEMAS